MRYDDIDHGGRAHPDKIEPLAVDWELPVELVLVYAWIYQAGNAQYGAKYYADVCRDSCSLLPIQAADNLSILLNRRST